MPNASKAAVLSMLGGEPQESLLQGLPADHEQKDEILKTALRYLSEKRVQYVPLDSEDSVDRAYDLPLQDFRGRVRAWMEELVELEKARRG